MFEKLRAILGKVDADYADVRYESKKDTVIAFTGRELTEIGLNTTDGFVLRALKSDGMASAVFTKESDADKAARKVTENAQLIGRNSKEPVQLAKTEAVKDAFAPPLKEDPRKIPIQEKLELVRKYNDIPLAHPKITTTSFIYQEIIREKHFVSSEGSEIREDLVTTRLSGGIVSKDGSLTQNVRVAMGGSNGFSTIRNQEHYVEDRTRVVVDLLSAKPIRGGTHNCVFNPSMAGVFTHEAFGHFSEADLIENLPTMREKMKLGNKLGNELLNISDDATMPDQLGFYKYDDEGVKVRPTALMKNGVLTGRMHSRRTAAAFGEPITGHCIAQDYRFPPIIRMGTIFIHRGALSLDELLSKLGEGYYVLDAKGGQTSGENFTFGAQFGYRVQGGKVKEMVRDINISGNLYETLKNIVALGDDFVLSKTGGCGKGAGSQTNIRSCFGGPHILVNNLVVGGA
jgi:TldD protein